MASTTRSFRGITRRAAIMYLEGLGGERTDAGVVEGDGWTARLDADSVDIGPTLSITEVTVDFEAETQPILDSVVEAFEQKAMRAGG